MEPLTIKLMKEDESIKEPYTDAELAKLLSCPHSNRWTEWRTWAIINYLVLPNQNFNAFFGTTAFSQKWTAALAGKVIEKKYSEGVSKYRIVDFS